MLDSILKSIGWRKRTEQEQYLHELGAFFRDRAKKGKSENACKELTLRSSYAAVRRKVSEQVLTKGPTGYHAYLADALKWETSVLRTMDPKLAFAFTQAMKGCNMQDFLTPEAWNQMLMWAADESRHLKDFKPTEDMWTAVRMPL